MRLSSRKILVGLPLLAGMAVFASACSQAGQPAGSAVVADVPAAVAVPPPQSTPQPAVADVAPAATIAPPSESTPPPASPPPASNAAQWGSKQTLKVGKSVTFADGLEVALNKIDDSRCAANVQCIWAGELAPELSLHGGALKAAQTISLGTVQAKSQTVAPYVVTLVDASSDSATLTVAKSDAVTTNTP